MNKVINKLINDAIEGADTYFHNGSIWLIFTEKKQWVIELTENGTLWYNYDFFKNLFNYASLGVVENQHYITMWVEDTLHNRVKDTDSDLALFYQTVEDTLHNRVKDTEVYKYALSGFVEDTIQNGVKDTKISSLFELNIVEDTIQNGVKDTERKSYFDESMVEDTIQNGVKSISQISREPVRQVEDVIQNGNLIWKK